MRRVVAVWLMFLLLITMLPQGWVVPADERQIIRVGYAEGSPFIRQENGRWVGYGVEYLEKLGDSLKWEYEYVSVEEEDVEGALAEQEIDIAFIHSGRENQYARLLQSEFFVAYENYVICADIDAPVYYDDFDALQNCTIGILEDGIDENAVYAFLRENGVSYKSRLYQSHDQLHEDLLNGVIDVICHGSLRDCDDIRIVTRFGINEYYCFTSNQNASLMTALNTAVKRMKFDEPNFEGELYEKYYGHSQVSDKPMFTKEEAEYIQNTQSVVVKLMKTSKPLSYLNSDGEADGIFVDFFALLEKKSGLKFEVQLQSDSSRMEALTEGMLEENYVMLRAKSAIKSSAVADDLSYSLPLVESHLTYIRRKDCVEDTGRKDYIFALTRDMRYIDEELSTYSSTFQVKYYDSTEACLDAVIDGEADIAIQDAYQMNYMFQRPIYNEELVETVGREWVNGLCVVTSEENALLMNIINKCILHITPTEREATPMLHILLNPYKATFFDIIHKYHDIIIVVTILAVITMIIYTVLIRNITKSKIEMANYKELQKKVQEDELTGLHNRPYFYRRSRERLNSTKEEMCIVLMNIVNFQVVNDLYGMDAGDLLLMEIADSLKEMSLQHNAVAGRFTGDRFYLCMQLKEFHAMTMPSQFSSQKMDLDIKFNYGVYIVGEQKDLPISAMCERAAIAAHNKERKEMEYIRYYSEDEHEQLLEEQVIEAEMRPALLAKQFCVFIQPKYDVEQEIIFGGEALVRWKHPEKGMIPPNKFIGIFERTGFIIQLDYYVWEETCKYIAKWKQQGILTGPISVNVSRAHLYNRELTDKLLELIAKYEISSKDLQLELTETICAEDTSIIYRKMQELRDCGFEIAMDDFGSGYSSLNMLKEIPLDVIKMDLKFLDGAGDQGKSRYILESLIRLAQNMQLHVVVEGVENQDQVEFLKSIGDIKVQGYYYSKPVEADEFAKMLTQ